MKKIYMLWLAKIVGCSLFYSLVGLASYAQTNVSGNQSGMWDMAHSPYTITNTVTVPQGSTLTINPGVVVQITTGGVQLKVQGTLKAIGTSADSIFFRKSGAFHGNDQIVPILFDITSFNTDLEYVAADGLGFAYNDNDFKAAIEIESNSLKISHCTFRNTNGSAIYIHESFKPIISNSLFIGNKELDIVLHPDELKNIDDNDSLKLGLFQNIVSIAFTDTLKFKAENFFYRLLNTITIPGGRKFIANPGSILQINTGAVQLNIQGTLIAIGKPDHYIKVVKNGGYHGNDQIVPIFFGTTSLSSILRFINIDGLGYAYNDNDLKAIIEIQSSLIIDSSYILRSNGSSIIIKAGAKPKITNNFISSTNMDVVLDPDVLRNLNGNNALKIGLTDNISMGLNDTLTSDNILYRLETNLVIPPARILAVDPNVILQFPTGAIQLLVQGSLKVLGTIDNNAQFTRVGVFHGNDQVVPIVFDVNSRDTLQYLTIDGLGFAYYNIGTPAMLIRTSACQINNTIFQNIQGLAVDIQNSSPTFKNSCFFNNLSGAVVSESGTASFLNCNFQGNNSGIVNKSTTESVNAANNWWGDPTGPYQRSTNPAGVGDSVSVGVLYNPFSGASFDCSEKPLPLTLLNFQANQNGTIVNCNWQTSAEINTSHFDLERSINGVNFSNIAKIVAAGNSNIIRNYQFSDKIPNSGINYYRLKMIDRDGKYSYSKVILINIKVKGSVTIYPNPVSNNLSLQVKKDKAEKITIQITDVQGKTLHEESLQLQAGKTGFTFNTSMLSKGIYLLVMKGNELEVKTFVKE